MNDLTKLYDGPDQWCKGPGNGGRGCIITRLVTQKVFAIDTVRKAAEELFPLRRGSDETYSLAAFNDAPETTFADIQALLKRAQEILEKDAA